MEKKKKNTMTLFEKDGDLEFFIDSQGGKKLIIKLDNSEMLVSFDDEPDTKESDQSHSEKLEPEMLKADEKDRKE